MLYDNLELFSTTNVISCYQVLVMLIGICRKGPSTRLVGVNLSVWLTDVYILFIDDLPFLLGKGRLCGTELFNSTCLFTFVNL